jgi:hypothetical protein
MRKPAKEEAAGLRTGRPEVAKRMSIVLYVLGILSAGAGLAAIAFGIPVKEFSFGDTLIVAGTTGFVGGLIVIGLGAVVTYLSRVIEMLGARPLQRMGRPLEPLETAGPGRVPFPAKPKNDAKPTVDTPVFPPRPVTEETKLNVSAPPILPNPDVTLAPEPEMPRAPRPAPAMPEMPVFPAPPKMPSRFAAAEDRGPAPFESFKRDPVNPPEPALSIPPAPEPGAFEPPLDEPTSPEPPRSEPSWRSPRPDRPSFDDLWPAQSRPAEPSRAESIPRVNGPASEPDLEPKIEAETPHEPVQATAPEAPPEPETQPVPILKSGVVDGMGYTLYVDGSIEAELPDGTLRFASINELRAHLERNA